MSEAGPSEGELVVISTPIGNLGDLSPRAAAALAGADLLCCEDTRHTGLMLQRLAIRPRRLLSVHAHNERQRVAQVLRELEAGHRVALVTDAGTPAVSDPGERLVLAAIDAGFKVTAVPGPSAAVMALTLAGAGVGRWAFEGFLPRRGAERAARIREIAGSAKPVVLYESPQRLVATLVELSGACGGERRVAVCRELTKLHEEVVRLPLAEAARHFTNTAPLGEITLVVHPRPAGETEAGRLSDGELRAEVDSLVRKGSSRRDAVSIVADRHLLARRAVYDVAVGPGGPGAPPPPR